MKQKKNSKIRHLEYYDLQNTLDTLYADSGRGKIFNNLMPLIESEENIRLAYRNIKRKLDYFTQGYTPIATRNKRRNNQGLPLTTTAHLQTKGKAKQATPTGKYASHLILKRVSLLLENCKFTLVNTES